MQPQQSSDHHPQPQMQFSNTQQFPPHMMLCPVQYVYDPQMLMPPSKPDEHVQPNQTFQNQTYLINVQNPPPWIQNRTNMVYMPQIQMNNLQPYVAQNMVQNPMFNYQYQPMIMQQDIRHMMPNLVTQNLVQNQQNTQNMVQNPQRIMQNPQNFIQNTQNTIQTPVRFQLEQKQDLPILSQMLQSQPKPALNQQNSLVAPMHVIRPQYQSVRPQMITVNPMSSNHTCVHHNSQLQKEQTPSETILKNEVPQRNEIPQKHEIPQHIRNQIPEGLSVKTLYKVSKTAMVRPNEYANIAPAKETPKLYPKPVMKHNMTNTEPKTNYKRKIRDVLEQNAKEGDVKTAKRNCEVRQDLADKVRSRVENNQINAFAAKHSLLRNVPLVGEGPQTVQNYLVNYMPQREEKLLRNTVYVQARGRINETLPNEMKIGNNTSTHSLGGNESLKKELNDTSNNSIEDTETLRNKTKNNTVNQNIGGNELFINDIKNANNYSNNHKTVDDLLENEINNEKDTSDHSIGLIESLRNEIKNDNNTSNPNIGANEPLLNEMKTANNTNTDRIEANEPFSNDMKNAKNVSHDEIKVFGVLPTETKHVDHTSNYSEGANEILQNGMNIASDQNMVGKLDNETETKRITHAQVVPVKESKEASVAENISKSTDENEISLPYNECGALTRNKSKITENIENLKKAESKDMVTADVYMKETIKKYVLTHVLDGHIIQESNVPFIVQKPLMSPIKKSPHNILEFTELSSNINKEETEKPSIDNIEAAGPIHNKRDTDIYSNNNIKEIAVNYNERDTKTNKEELAKNSAKPVSVRVTEEQPFEHIKKSTVKSWTVSDVFSHLNNTNWLDSALKLREEEIDGESLLLVNKEQLLQIGISEKHAQILSAYLEKTEAQ